MSFRRIASRLGSRRESRTGHVPGGRRTNKGAAGARRRLLFEALEDRRLLAVRIWDGGADASWNNPLNGVGDVTPVAGDDLVFPAGAANLANTNDLAAGTRFNTIQIQGSGYDIGGNAIELYGGLTANNAGGSNTWGVSMTLINAVSLFSANAGTTLNLSGTIKSRTSITSTSRSRASRSAARASWTSTARRTRWAIS